MISTSKRNHTTAGLLSKFLSRCNDIDGYWAPGVLYTQARTSANRVVIDMLNGDAQPASPVTLSMARTWVHYLRQALARHGVSPDSLRRATMSIDFCVPPGAKRQGFEGYGDPFLCTLRLQSRDGRESIRQERSRCMPHDEFWGSRSTRRAG